MHVTCEYVCKVYQRDGNGIDINIENTEKRKQKMVHFHSTAPPIILYLFIIWLLLLLFRLSVLVPLRGTVVCLDFSVHLLFRISFFLFWLVSDVVVLVVVVVVAVVDVYFRHIRLQPISIFVFIIYLFFVWFGICLICVHACWVAKTILSVWQTA